MRLRTRPDCESRPALLIVLGALIATSTGCSMPEPFRVMSFNVRYGTAKDGLNSWEHRADQVVDTIRANDPDVLGLQEVLDFQAEYLQNALRDYEFIGVGRDDGDRGGEFCPIMYRKAKFRLMGRGHLWLSDEPRRPGSVGWDAALPRILTWARLQFKSNTLNEIFVINTHLDHKGEEARRQSAEMIRRLTDSMSGRAIVVMGDFNASPDSQVYRTLTDKGANRSELRDPFRWLEVDTSGTFNAFEPTARGPRIDWILYNRRFKPSETVIDRRNFDGRPPSDHFPVITTLELLPVTNSGAV